MFIEVSVIYDAIIFSITERRYITYKRELCVMIKFALKHHYLLRNLNRHVIIYINYKSLTQFLNFNMHDKIYDH